MEREPAFSELSVLKRTCASRKREGVRVQLYLKIDLDD